MSPSLCFSRVIRLLCAALAFSAFCAAQAQLRTIPADAKRATLTHVEGMSFDLDGKRIILSAGAQIRDSRNMIMLPTAVPPGSRVKFQPDVQGQVWRVWILSPEEAAQPDPKK